MNVTYEKLPIEHKRPDACHNCDGHGRILVRPQAGWREPYTQVCATCLGTKSVTDDVRERKAAGSALTLAMDSRRLTALDCAKKFGGRVQDWVDARTGFAPMPKILEYYEMVDQDEQERT